MQRLRNEPRKTRKARKKTSRNAQISFSLPCFPCIPWFPPLFLLMHGSATIVGIRLGSLLVTSAISPSVIRMNHPLLLRLAASASLICAATAAHAQVCQVRNGHDRGTAVCVGTFDSTGAAVIVTAGHLCRGAAAVQVAPEGRWID